MVKVTRGEGWGGGARSLGPYLLGSFSEAPQHHLVARESGGAERDSAWSRERAPPPRPPVPYRRLKMFRSLQHANPTGESDEQTLGQLGHLTQHFLKVLPIDHEHAQRRGRPHRDGPRPAVEQTHLAEEIPGTQEGPLLARLLHGGGTVDDHEELVAGLPGARERGSRRHLHHPRDVGECPELLLGAIGEQRHVLEVANLLVVAHARPRGLGATERLLEVLRNRAIQDAAYQFHATSSIAIGAPPASWWPWASPPAP